MNEAYKIMYTKQPQIILIMHVFIRTHTKTEEPIERKAWVRLYLVLPPKQLSCLENLTLLKLESKD